MSQAQKPRVGDFRGFSELDPLKTPLTGSGTILAVGKGEILNWGI